MGEPLECEKAINGDGDTQQKTSTGLAYYRNRGSIAVEDINLMKG